MVLSLRKTYMVAKKHIGYATSLRVV